MQRIYRQGFMVEIQRASAVKMKVPSPELQLLEGVSSPSVDRTSQNILSHNPMTYSNQPQLRREQLSRETPASHVSHPLRHPTDDAPLTWPHRCCYTANRFYV